MAIEIEKKYKLTPEQGQYVEDEGRLVYASLAATPEVWPGTNPPKVG